MSGIEIHISCIACLVCSVRKDENMAVKNTAVANFNAHGWDPVSFCDSVRYWSVIFIKPIVVEVIIKVIVSVVPMIEVENIVHTYTNDWRDIHLVWKRDFSNTTRDRENGTFSVVNVYITFPVLNKNDNRDTSMSGFRFRHPEMLLVAFILHQWTGFTKVLKDE